MKSKRLVCGVGVNDVDAPTRACKAYSIWKQMLARCYSTKTQSSRKNKCYRGCSVDVRWHKFSAFRDWFCKNYKGGHVHIDKDEFGDGYIYSPETCQLVSAARNIEISHAKNYLLISPDGEVVNIYNMKKFCMERGLLPCKMSMVANGKRKSHKGWRKAKKLAAAS